MEKTFLKSNEVRKPAPGIIVHFGNVKQGKFSTGDQVIAELLTKKDDRILCVTILPRIYCMRNYESILGEHVRQAGSLVAPDRLRFDFTHPSGLSKIELQQVECGKSRVLNNYPLTITQKKLIRGAWKKGQWHYLAKNTGKMVRTIAIGEKEKPFSYELCGGTHVSETSEIGTFIITSEGSAAAGIRRIEAVTGRKAYETISLNVFRS